MFDSILVVCTGNICRSPIGERILQRAFPGKIIKSAGTGALVGQNAGRQAYNVASQNGLSLDGHKGRQFTSSLSREYELILVMEKYHMEQIGKIAPEARGKTLLYGQWIGQKDIPDPYRKSDEAFFSVYKLIEQASQGWIEKLST